MTKAELVEAVSRVSDLTRGKAEKFSLDMLVQFAAKLGKPARIVLAK